jgi:hypothetical protein
MLHSSQTSQTLNPSSFIVVFHSQVTNLQSFLFGSYFHLEVTNLPFVSYCFIQKTNRKSFLFHPKSQTLDCSILWLFSSQKAQTLGPSLGAIVFIQNQTLGPCFFELLFSSNNHKLDVQTFFIVVLI